MTDHLVWMTTESGPATDYFASHDLVTFNAGGTANSIVTLSGNLTPSTVTVTGPNTYTFTGAGSLTNSGALNITGSGSLIIANSGNCYTLGTNIQSGQISLAVQDGLPTTGAVDLRVRSRQRRP